MPVDANLAGSLNNGVINVASFWALVQILVIILSGVYFFFSLVVVRQINLMTETLITEVAPVMRAFAIVHAGLALGIIILFVGILFS